MIKYTSCLSYTLLALISSNFSFKRVKICIFVRKQLKIGKFFQKKCQRPQLEFWRNKGQLGILKTRPEETFNTNCDRICDGSDVYNVAVMTYATQELYARLYCRLVVLKKYRKSQSHFTLFFISLVRPNQPFGDKLK